ncbi:hypothetical protein BCR39DRAFT_586187 [Naematelia encephala]|uniref:SUZ domain-containing protein n=1 Tax=Naematelia encephala TaxID=71784 RepID=A0A1Y2BHJ6_9TREE|nr:hypothetical protein BCR39DRAFT_586187 [Naematelia encephala]
MSVMTSPTPATPRPAAAKLSPTEPSHADRPPNAGNPHHDTIVNGQSPGDSQDKGLPNGGIELSDAKDGATEEYDAFSDGRLTPVASEGGIASNSSSGPPCDSPTPNSTSVSSGDQVSFTSRQTSLSAKPPAEVGFGSYDDEQQLKQALMSSKDRIFVVITSREIEGFISRLSEDDKTVVARAGPSTLAPLGQSFKLTMPPSSKFQAMLVYKIADWYGLKGVRDSNGVLHVGVENVFHEKSKSLVLSSLVPAPKEDSREVRIMQRRPATNGTSSTSSPAPDSVESARRPLTLEEREEAYNRARERIMGSTATEDIEANLRPDEEEAKLRAPPTRRPDDDEPDPIPRYPNVASAAGIQPIYPSLQDPPRTGQSAPQQAYPAEDPSFAFQGNGVQYPMYGPTNASMPYGPTPYPQTAQPPYMSQALFHNGQVFVPAQNTYWQQPASGYAAQVNNQRMMPVPVDGWYNNTMPMPLSNQPLQMIPQGMPFQQQYYPQQVMYNHLAQPVPVRPQPQHHSSASSTSSRSLQDFSRPHSRGSTTSTRSATSSVRLGALFPAGQGPGYRQKGMNASNYAYSRGDRRSTRGHSPESVTTTSSRSSRRTSSINLPQPSNHQLPTRPDWAVNNIPYHPSPMLPPGSQMTNGPNVADFPPLRNGTDAVPMQVERARMPRPANGNVWNGGASRSMQNVPPNGASNNSPMPATRSPHPQHAIPGPAAQPAAPTIQNGDHDPDFPRRAPVLRNVPVLFDPSAPRPASRDASVHQSPAITATNPTTVDDEIEARLAAVSMNAGVTIGPPPARSVIPPSYAKIVRRE